MKGVQQGYELPAEAEDDVWSLNDRERKSLGIDPLPKTLYEAIGVMENSEMLAETVSSPPTNTLKTKPTISSSVSSRPWNVDRRMWLVMSSTGLRRRSGRKEAA